MTETNLDHIPRYAYDGGFRVELLPTEKINIKIVGMGFEARETSEVVHEEYEVLWKNFKKLRAAMRLSGQDFAQAKVISTADYRVSAKHRLDFLVDACGFPAYLVLDFLPMKEYAAVGAGVEEKILKIIFERNFLDSKIIYGEVIGGHIKTWEHSYNTPMYWY